MFLDDAKKVPVADIVVKPDRQRKEITEESLAEMCESITRLGGLIHPILLDKDNVLIAGERRLRAHIALGLPTIDARFHTTENPQELEVIELEENLKRQDLTWQDKVAAIGRLHTAYGLIDPAWTVGKTAAAVGLNASHVSHLLGIDEEVKAGNTKVLAAGKMSEAMTAIKRKRNREMEDLIGALEDPTPAQVARAAKDGAPSPAKPSGPVLHGDFLEWSASYSGPKFNFIHCDFPYGVGMHKSGQASHALGTYEDTKDIYFTLLEAFVKNYSNFGSSIAHIMFWYSQKFDAETKDLLARIPGAKVFPFRLIWHKSDGKGIVPDQMREGRRTYETAFLVSVGDRHITKIANMSIAAPTDSAREHVSRKPPGVLASFFPMFIEPGKTRMLDPTCGSGSALVVAKSLGAEVFGIERDEEYVKGIRL